MAHITTNTPIAAVSNPFSAIARAAFNMMVRIGEMNSRVRETERLNALSDAELAKRGLKRDEIVHHVFRDLLYV